MGMACVVNGLDIVHRCFEIHHELYSNNSYEVKVKKITWNMLAIAANGVVLIGDPVGRFALLRTDIPLQQSSKTVYFGKKVLGLIRASESITAAGQELMQIATGKVGAFIAYTRIFAGTVFCVGESIILPSDLKLVHLPTTISSVCNVITKYGENITLLLDSIQTAHRRHASRVVALGFHAVQFTVRKIHSLWSRFSSYMPSVKIVLFS